MGAAFSRLAVFVFIISITANFVWAEGPVEFADSSLKGDCREVFRQGRAYR